MKFTGFTISFALASAVSAAALPAVPGGAAITNLEGTVGAVGGVIAGGAVKRDDADPLTGAVYGATSSLDGVTGIAGSAAGTVESTSSGLVGTAEAEVAGLVPAGAKRQLANTEGTVAGLVPAAKRQLANTEGAVAGLEAAGEGLLAGAKRDGTDALSGVVYGATSNLNGVTGIVGSAAGTAESTSSGLVGTAEAEVAGLAPAGAKRQLPGLGNIVSASLTNDLAMLSGNPSGLIGALGGLQAALSTGGILPSQVATFPAELQHVVALIYTE